MRKHFLIIGTVILLLFLFLTACSTVSEDGTYYTVTFYDGEDALTWKRLEEGSPLRLLPTRDLDHCDILAWTDSSGQLVDPEGMSVTADMDFYVYHLPELKTDGHIDYMDWISGSWFYPDAGLRRGEAAQIFYNILRNKDGTPLTRTVWRPELSDLSGNPYATPARVLVSWHLMSSYEDGTFRPYEVMTRAEFVSILSHFCPASDSADTGFSDVPADHWAAAAIAAVKNAGWLDGFDDGSFYPDEPITRAEAVVILNRALDYKVDSRMLSLAGNSEKYLDLSSDHWAYYNILEAVSDSELLRYIRGEVPGEESGFVFIGEEMGYVNPETMVLQYFDAGFHTLDGGLYYAAENGYFLERYEEGCHEVDGSLFYVTEDDGPFLTDESWGYLYFGEDGRYTSGDADVDAYVDSILSGIAGNENMSRWEQLYAAYCSIRDGGYTYQHRAGYVRGSTSWTLDCAWVMYEYKSGSCFYWASSFLYLARRLGFQAYAVSGGVGTRNQLHAWVVVEWTDGCEYICDVELEWAYARGYYDGKINPTNMFMQPRNETKVIYVFPNGLSSSTYYGYSNYTLEESDEDYLIVVDDPQEEDPQETPSEPTPTPETPPTPVPVTTPTPAPVIPAETATPVVTTAPAETEMPVATDAPAEDPVPVEPDPAPVDPEPVDPAPQDAAEDPA